MTSRATIAVCLSFAFGCGFIEVESLDDVDDNPCWTRTGGDRCSDPPPFCPYGEVPLFPADDLDGTDDGEIYVLNSSDAPTMSCATLHVAESGHYRLFGSNFAGSCSTQLDESAYFTVHNSCNADGWPAERNASDWFVLGDPDNTSQCASDAECPPGSVCSGCCQPRRVFLGTFLLLAGEPNRICLNHWCDVYAQELASGVDWGFTVDRCKDVNSVHLTMAHVRGCLDPFTKHACAWGCDAGTCLPDPCDAMSCDAYCMDGVCLDDNPCERISCLHGCSRGRCLQGPTARGPDADLDGFPALADCDDHDPLASPDLDERCGNAADDDCDGLVDESGCG